MILLSFNETVVEKDSVREIIIVRPTRMPITARSGGDDEPVIIFAVGYIAGVVLSMLFVGVPICNCSF